LPRQDGDSTRDGFTRTTIAPLRLVSLKSERIISNSHETDHFSPLSTVAHNKLFVFISSVVSTSFGDKSEEEEINWSFLCII